ERAQENFGSLFSFIQSLDEAVKANLGAGAISLEFGDYNDLTIPRFIDSPKNRLPWGDFGIRHGA
ncbi:MAG TPA: hypothetical protein VGT81_15570, partial [Casimicrobiaceae bacterium]|nr:hypothetical protein [Casimicrobiaceae bacterium]